MKKPLSIVITAAAILSVSLCAAAIFSGNRGHIPDKDKVLAAVGEVSITEEDVSLIQDCDALVNSLLGVRGSGTSEREALERAISQEVKREMIREKGLSLSEAEKEEIKNTVLADAKTAEYLLANGSEQEKEMAQKNADIIQAFLQVYQVSMEEYNEMCVDASIFAVESARLVSQEFGGDEAALEAYIKNHYKEYCVTVNQ